MELFVQSVEYSGAIGMNVTDNCEDIDRRNFYGTYHKYSEKFKFTIGDKFLINSLIRLAESINSCQFVQFTNKTRKETPELEANPEYDKRNLTHKLSNHNYPSDSDFDP